MSRTGAKDAKEKQAVRGEVSHKGTKAPRNAEEIPAGIWTMLCERKVMNAIWPLDVWEHRR